MIVSCVLSQQLTSTLRVWQCLVESQHLNLLYSDTPHLSASLLRVHETRLRVPSQR